MGQITAIDFRGGPIFAAERPDGVFVAVTPICQRLGLDASKQQARIQRDPILAEGGATMALPSTGGVQDTFCLRLDLMHGWLFTIDADRVRPEIRDDVLAYKRECYAALARHFAAGVGEVSQFGTPSPDEPLAIRCRLVTEARQTHGTQAARELWMQLNLPTTPAMLADQGQQSLFTYTTVPHRPADQH